MDAVIGKQAALEAAMNEEFYKATHAEGHDESSISLESDSDSEHEAAPPKKKRTPPTNCVMSQHNGDTSGSSAGGQVSHQQRDDRMAAAATGRSAHQQRSDDNETISVAPPFPTSVPVVRVLQPQEGICRALNFSTPNLR